MSKQIKAADLSLVDTNQLSEKQLALIFKKTPAKYIRTRPAKGGGKWRYVSGGYVIKILNLMFGWNWDFEILRIWTEGGEALVHGKLTCRNATGQQIIKNQIGKKEIITKRGSNVPLSIGNDYKAAATDAMKKCAMSIGIAQDVYNSDEFNELEIQKEPEEIAGEKEVKRVIQHIMQSETIEQLKEVDEVMEEIADESMRLMYENRMETILTKNKPK